MALSEIQKSKIKTTYTTNYYDKVDNPTGLSNRAIAKDANCSESAVRTAIKKLIKEGVEKNALNALAKREVHTIIIQDGIDEQKDALTPEEKNAYDKVLKTHKKTIDIATSFQDIIIHRQSADIIAIDTLIKMKAKELTEAKDLEDILRINMKFRDYMSVIADYKDIKDGIEANDKAMITKGEAPRFAPKAETTQNFLNLTDTAEGTKGKF